MFKCLNKVRKTAIGSYPRNCEPLVEMSTNVEGFFFSFTVFPGNIVKKKKGVGKLTTFVSSDKFSTEISECLENHSPTNSSDSLDRILNVGVSKYPY